MHNLNTNFKKFYRICKEVFKYKVNDHLNFRTYPVKPKMNDLKIIALSCCMEGLGIDSENLLWAKLQSDYKNDFKDLIHRTRFNRRRRRLHDKIGEIQAYVSDQLGSSSKSMIIDSIPVPIVKLIREKTYRSFKQQPEHAPAKGFSSVNKSWFIGYKLHAVIWDDGVVQQSGITPGNVHDINFLKQAKFDNFKTELIGDRAYISKVVQLNLFEEYNVKLTVPYRSNQHDYKKHPVKLKNKRQMVETFFAQLCDQMNLRRNYAKSFQGLLARIASKVSCMSILNLINFQCGRKLSQVKHALCFQ
jgi:hypothetical protein